MGARQRTAAGAFVIATEPDTVVITRAALQRAAYEAARAGYIRYALWLAEMSEPTSLARCPLRLPVELAEEMGFI